MLKLQRGTVKLFIPILIFILVTGTLYFLFSNNQKSENTSEINPTNSISPTPTLNPAGGTEPSTLDWTEYSGSEFVYANNIYSGYSIKYPHTCIRTNSILNCKFTNGTGVIQLNAGGHGMEPAETRVIKNAETKVIDAGEGKITLIELVKDKRVVGTYWINKTDKLTQEPIFGFEFKDIPTEDLPEFEQIFDLMLTTFKFINKTNASSIEKDGCVISGCSNEICADTEMVSTCELKPEAVCYKTATCEKQANGKCGWTQTSELTSCLNQY